MPTNMFGRVELLLAIIRYAIPALLLVFLIVFVVVVAFMVKYRRALKHKILQLPVRNVPDQRRRSTYYVQQHTRR
jgi:hypothetical protein